MRTFAIAAILAVLITSPAIAQSPQTNESYIIGQAEMHQLIYGRTTRATTAEGSPISTTFKTDGTYETYRGGFRTEQGTWSVEPDGSVVRAGMPSLHLRKEGGKYYSTNTGNEVQFVR